MALLDGKIVLVTGAGSGIGAAACREAAAEGAVVVAADLRGDAAAATAAAISEAGGQASHIEVDIARDDSVRAMVAAVIERHGRLDGAFNNAGIEIEHEAPPFDEAVFDRHIAVNLKGTWLCLRAELAAMQAGGAIVNTASVAGLVGAPGLSSYAASKHGVVGLTRSFAVEQGRRGIRINAVCPGVIRTAMADAAFARQPQAAKIATAMHPIGRLGEAQEVASVAIWLLSDKAGFVTGATWTVDGGLTAQ